MNKQVVTITFNPAYDLLGQCQQIQYGRINAVQTLGLYPAGKGVNVANVLAALGIHATVGGFLGRGNREGFEQAFQQWEIVNRFQLIDGNTRINVKLTEHPEQTTEFNFSGFTVSGEDWQRFVEPSLPWLAQFSVVVIAGSLPLGIKGAAFGDWMAQLCRRCARVVFDSSGEALAIGLKQVPWLIKPNRQELESWCGRQLPELNDVITVAEQLRKQGITHVVVSLGEDGVVWASELGIWLARPPKISIISTVGAGDSLVAGLVYGLLNQELSIETLRLATALSVLTVMQGRIGMIEQQNLLEHPKLARLIKQVELLRLA